MRFAIVRAHALSLNTPSRHDFYYDIENKSMPRISTVGMITYN